MSILHSVFLGIIQGITEFLPISSSGHLVLARKLVPGFWAPGVLFEVVLHAGTLLAVIFYFRKRILTLKKEYLTLLIIGTLPAIIIGGLFSSYLESLFVGSKFIGIGFMLTGVLNLATDRFGTANAGPVSKSRINFLDSLLIGFAQAFAIIPSVSRSGTTIFTGAARGLPKSEVAEFSFLLSVPAIFGANVFEIIKYRDSLEADILPYFSGFLVSIVVGYYSIKAVYWFLETKNFKVFAYYCFLVGAVSLLIF